MSRTNLNVETFIEKFKKDFYNGNEEEEILERFFTCGYCYHFAIILENLFDGYVMYNPVENHFAYMSSKTHKIYDITGCIGKLKNDGTDLWDRWDYYKITEPVESERIEEQCLYKL